MRAWLLTLLCAAALASFVLAPSLPDGVGLGIKDAGHLFPSLKERVARAWARGELPLWNPDVGCGVPLLADPMSQALYPPNAVFLGTDAFTGMKRFVWLHLALLVPAFVLAARSYGVATLPALAVALGFVGAGPVLSQHWSVMWMGGLVGFLVGLAGLRGVLRGAGVWTAAGAALVAGASWMVLAGAFEVLLAFAAWAVAEVAVHVVARGRAAGRGVVAVGACVALAIGICAVQLLPTYELVGLSSRAGGVDTGEAYLWSLSAPRLLELVAPGLFGNSVHRTSWILALQPQQFKIPYLGGIYLGAPLLVLALAGLSARGRGVGRYGGLLLPGAVLVTVVMALGEATPLLPLMREVVPGVGLFRYPEKLLTLTTVAVSLLAALGLQRCARGERDAWRVVAWAAGALLALLCAGGAVGHVTQDAVIGWIGERLAAAEIPVPAAGAWRGAMVAAANGAGVASLLLVPSLLWLRGESHRRRWWLGTVAVLVAVATPIGCAELVGVRRIEDILARPGALPAPEALVTPTGPARLATQVLSLEPHHLALLGYRAQGSYGSVALQPEHRLVRVLSGQGGLLVELASVRFLVGRALRGEHAGSRVVVELPEPLPRASLLPLAVRAVDAGDEERLLQRPGWEPRIEVVLAPAPVSGAYPGDALPQGPLGPGEAWAPGEVRVEEEVPLRLRLRVRAPAGGWLVVTDTWYPGWEASIDGAPVPLEAANIRFRAVRVPPGEHVVEMRYRPASVRWGLAVSLLALLVWLVPLAVGPLVNRGAPPRP
jgi:hypothetical protein